MVSTFISLLDIQSWWEIPCIAHFCSLFSSAFDLPDIDIEDLESALLTDGTEETVGLLPELIVRILKGCDLLRTNRDEITTSNYQMFLRRFLRHQCRKNNVENYFDTDTDFSSLPVRNKLLILHSLCHFRLESTDVFYKFNNLEANSLRVEPLGFDSKNSGYWYFFGTRLYREDIKSNSEDTIWQVVCFTEEDWQNLSTKLKSCKTKKERALLKILEENFLPKLPQLFLEREKLRRRKLFQNRNSARIRATDIKYKVLHEKQDLERIEREKYEEQLKLAEATNKKRRRSRSESSGSGVSTYASSIRPSLNSSDFLFKREKFCLSPDLGASSLSPPPASLIHNHASLFPPTPSQSPTLEKSLKTFNDIDEYEAPYEEIEKNKLCHTDITYKEGTVTEAKVFLEINNQNNSTPNQTFFKDQRDSNFTPESVLKSDIKSNKSSNCIGHSDDYDDAISLISFDEDKENLICYKRSDTESETDSINYYSNSPTYCGIVGGKNAVDIKLEEKTNNMAPITSSATVKLPGRQTNNSLSSISENIFIPTLETTSASKKNIKNMRTGKKEMKAPKTKPTKNEKTEKIAKKTKNSPTEKSDKIVEKNEVIDSDNSQKKKKSRNSESFTETDEVLQIGMHKVLVYVKNHRDAWPFMDPVEEDIAPRYYSIIRRPMDLLKMEDKLDNGEYKKFSEFRNDFKLIVNNCRLYNGQNNEYTEMVNNLQEAFDKATKKYFDNLSDEEDEIGYPESKLNVFREKYFNKNNSNDEEIDKISNNIIIENEEDNKGFTLGETDEDDSKFESKSKTSKRKHKDKDKRRKKKIKLDDTNSIHNDETDEEDYVDKVKKLDNENDAFECDQDAKSEADCESNAKGKNKKTKKITEINKSKKKDESKQKDKERYRKQKEDHSNKDVKHKSKIKDCEKNKETNIKKHVKKTHWKNKGHKEEKETAQHLNEMECDIKETDCKNTENQCIDTKSNMYDFDPSEMSDENLESKNKTKKHGVKDNKKPEKMLKYKKGKENQLKSNKGKPAKGSSVSSESRSKKKSNTKIKKDKPNTNCLDELDSKSEDSEIENQIVGDCENVKKASFFSDSSRSPTPNFKIDLHKKYANTLTPTKSASLESRFSNDIEENTVKNDDNMEENDDGEIQDIKIDSIDKEDGSEKRNEKKMKKNAQKRNKDFKRKNNISKSSHKNREDEIDLNTKPTKNHSKKIKSKLKSVTHFTAKSKVISFKKSKKKINKIFEEKSSTRNETEETGATEDVISNRNQSLRSRSQSPSVSDCNEKSFKHRTKLTKSRNKIVQESRKQNNQKGGLKNKVKESTDSDAGSSDEDENNSTVEKDANNDMQIPLFLDKYDLIKQRRRCAALNSKKEEEKVVKSSNQTDKGKIKKGKGIINSNKKRGKVQKSNKIVEKSRTKINKNRDRKGSMEEEICESEIRSEENDQKEDLQNLQDKNFVEKSIKHTEKNLKKSQTDSGKSKVAKSQNNVNTISETKDNRTKETKSKENKQKESKPLKKKEEEKHDVTPGVLGSLLQNKKSHLKKHQILESLATSLSSTSNLINKKKGKSTLGTPPVAIVAPTQSLTNSSLIKCDSANKATNMEALELETEQTLKDINRWLEHTPRFSEFSSASNSPNRYNLLDDFDAVAAKLDPADFRRPGDTINTGTVNGSVAPAIKSDVDSKLVENFDETKKPPHDNKLISDLIPVAPASNKINILNNKELDSQNLSGTNMVTHPSMSSTSIVGSSSSPINHKSKEPNTTQLLPHPPPPPPHIKNQLQKEAKRKSLKEKLSGVGRRKDLLRTIDRLHPGKSKGNLLTANKPEEIFPLGAVSKVKEVKNSLVVETDESAPKLSLGSVLNTSGFGLGQLHNFGDEIASNDFKISEAITLSEESDNTIKNDAVMEKSEKPSENSDEIVIDKECYEETRKDDTKPFQCKKEELLPKSETKLEDGKSSSATPNLSAWFKAFGAPKKTKKPEDEDEKKKLELAESGNNNQNISEDPSTSPNKNLKSPAQNGQDNFSLPAPRQRKASTGSTVSERSSYSHDPDSPRIGIEDRFGPYPSSYTSPIGTSPIMVSPKPDEVSKPSSPYPLNGTIKVGFYQDTTTKSSPEKSCSPRELPSSAYAQYSQHIYSGNSPNINASTDTASSVIAPYGAGNNQTGNSVTNGTSAYNVNNDQKKTPSSSSFSPRSPVQPPTPTLYEQYKQPQSQESDYNSSMSPSTNPNSPYQQPQSSPYHHNSSSPYHQSSNPNSPYQQPHSPFSNQQGQSGQGPPSSGPPSVGSMHIVTNSPNHPNSESPRGQNSPYQQQMNSPYQQSDHSSPYNQNQNPTSPYQQSSSPAHSSVVVPSQQSSQSNTQTKTNFAHSPNLNLETAPSALEKHQMKLQKPENENIYESPEACSNDGNLKVVGNQNTDGSNQKLQVQSATIQHGNSNQIQQNIIQPQHQNSQSQPQPQQLVSQIVQSPHYHTTHSQSQNQNQVSRGAFESSAINSNSVLNQELGQISNQPSDQASQANSTVTDKSNLGLQPQYAKYPQYSIPSSSDKSSSQCNDFVSDLSLQLASKQNSINVPGSQTQVSQQQKQQLQQSLQRSMNSQNLHQSTHNIQNPQVQQQQQNSSHNIQQTPQQIKRNYETSAPTMNVNYAQQNQNAINDIKSLKSEEKQLLLHQQQQREQHQQQHQEQSQVSQQQTLYDSAAINKHQQMFDGFLSSMTAAKNIGFNKSLDITSSKAYEVLNKAAAMGFSNPLVQAAAAAAMSNKDNLQQHQPIISSHISQQQKNENLTNLYSQPLAQVNNNNRINLSHQSQSLQSQQHQQQQQQQPSQTQQLQQQRPLQSQRSQQSQQPSNSHNPQSSAIPLYGGSKSSHNVATNNAPYGSQNIGQRNENNPTELIPNSLNRNLDLSNYKTSSTYQNSSNIIDHTMRHHSSLTQMMDDTNMLALQNNTPGTMGTSYYDKNVPPAAHMFSKNLPQQLYQNSSTIYGGRDQQNLPPPGNYPIFLLGNYVPQSNQSSSSANSNVNPQGEQVPSATSTDQKQTKRNKKKKVTELANLNQSTINHQSPVSNIQQQPQNLQLQQHQQQEQQILNNNSSQNTTNTPGNNITQNVASAHQGFQLYAGLKTAAAVVAASTSTNQTISGTSNNTSTDPSALSLKTAAAAASMVSGSAFNFGPSPTGLPLPSGLYGDNSTYLEEFRNANPYYIPPTHHRVPQDSTNNPNQTSVSEKTQSSTINNNTTPSVAPAAPSPYHQFLTAAAHPATQRGSYPFMNSPQLDPNSPLYTQYLRPDEFRARMMQNLSQSLLPPGATAGYPQAGYRPTLGMPKPYDMNNRQPWF
ncbi:protein split ends isoform X2 [Condylostylus longicornis]|uniref:protein split ends isoform X2 n=1 Tax=Condylostylus longicornis TaxID=2530218 RepID=UPI00244DECCA|nr:protein split ends isoform X2 [Condylostylus longicornis]